MTSEDGDREQEVDTRFALANERTLLAWVRTALALLASGAAVQKLSDLPGRGGLAVFLCLVGIGAALAGGARYHRTEAALRRGQGPIPGGAPVVLAGAIAVSGVALVVAIVFA